MRTRLLLLFVVPTLAMIVLAGVAYGNPSSLTDMDQAKAAGWDCTPEVPIAGNYLHCAPPGKPSVAEIATGSGSTVPSVVLRVFNLSDESYAGIETLIRSDLYHDQPCNPDVANLPNGTWSLLVLPGADYRACHRFERTST